MAFSFSITPLMNSPSASRSAGWGEREEKHRCHEENRMHGVQCAKEQRINIMTLRDSERSCLKCCVGVGVGVRACEVVADIKVILGISESEAMTRKIHLAQQR